MILKTNTIVINPPKQSSKTLIYSHFSRGNWMLYLRMGLECKIGPDKRTDFNVVGLLSRP